MSSGTRKRGLGDDPPCDVDNGTKRIKENELLPDETDSFCFVDDVTLELRSIEGYVGQVKSDDFRKVVDKLEKSDTLIRKKQGEDDTWPHIIHVEDITELHRLVGKYCTRTGIVKLEKLVEKIILDDQLLRRQTNHREVSNRVSENVDRQLLEPLHQELHRSQATEQMAATIVVGDEVTDSKPDTQNLLCETKSFGFIDDVITDLRSIEGYVAGVKSDNFRKCLEKLDKSDILVRKKQGQDDQEHRVIYKEDITEVRRLVDKYSTNTGRRKFERLIQTIASDARLLTRQTNHIEDSNRLSENADFRQQQEPFQQELHSSQTIEQPTTSMTVEDEDELIDIKPDIRNLSTGGEGHMSSFYETVDPPPVEFSNELKNAAQINFNDQLLRRLVELRKVKVKEHKVVVEEICHMIKQRTALVKLGQYEYSLIDQQQFNQELMIKLRGLEQYVDPKMKIMLTKVANMLQSIGLASCQFNSPFFQYLTDFDLLKCIASNSDSVAAQHVLRDRKMLLLRLTIESVSGIMYLNLNKATLRGHSAGVSGPTYRKFQYKMEVNNVEAIHLLGLFNAIMQFYDVSQASFSLRSDGSNSFVYHQLMESTFGAPPRDRNGKIRVKEIMVESPEMIDFLRWFCPMTLNISCDSGVLVNETSLACDVDAIEFRKGNVDQLMEDLKAPAIRLEGQAAWSDESIHRVLTAHGLATPNGSKRVIACRCQHFETLEGWRELFDNWSRTFEAEHGKIGRKVTMSDNTIDLVTLTLH